MAKSSSFSSKAAKATGVLDYLQKALPKQTLRQLYADDTRGHYVCRAVLQQLPGLAQQVVIRLSCCGGTFARKGVQIWTKQQFAAYQHDLSRWAIIEEIAPSTEGEGAGEGDKSTISLTPEYYKGLRYSLESMDSSPWQSLTPEQIVTMAKQQMSTDGNMKKPKNIKIPTPEDLERYTEKKWNAVLHFLVGSTNQSPEEEPHAAVINFLLQTGLMQADPDYKGGDPDDAPLVISTQGYDFMLQEQHQQVWHFVVQYLKYVSEKKAKRLLEALLFLMCLSFGRLGDGYSEKSLGKHERTFMKDLSMFGLLYVVELGDGTHIFYPTRVAIQLVQGKHSSSGAGSDKATSKAVEQDLQLSNPSRSSHLAIIVQTNFMVCAYTTSELHVSMLGLFCDVHTIRRLPNMVFMVLTRDSVKSAFALGIQAKQILRFLEKHAHPKLLESGQPPIPENVQDQIWLWDRERHRVVWSEVFVHQCVMAGEFRAVKQYALDIHGHKWSSESRKEVFVDYKHVEKVLNFVRQWRARTVAREG
eukprot:CAMPEP_0195284978 /NCGR_PEP_ID=MMETSP0707-20130614/2978_1 /TAXON_ID=33640 /ORGANISM="Asterionellopsis glacialis, Strain CCMP134" /LENGTH=528 /DNA_ID=CAMNT_0040344397 /DNA_START=147 /DNA_END=1733 /DNA_ORIENTATION=+